MDFFFHRFLIGVHTDLSFALSGWFVFYGAIYKGKKRMVFAYTYIVTWINTGSTLTNQYSPGQYLLTAVSFNSKTLGFAVPSTACAAATFLMCH
jgi:hypothetical protein